MDNPAAQGIAAARRDAYQAGLPPMELLEPDYKSARIAEWLRGPQGKMQLVRTCANLEGGRWEYFISIEAEFDLQGEVR